jgi:hypothetical protein
MGVISGIVTRNGYPVQGARIGAYFSGLSGGVTDGVYSDSDGRFTLQWRGDGTIDILYCNGQEKLKNVRNGRNDVHIAL